MAKKKKEEIKEEVVEQEEKKVDMNSPWVQWTNYVRELFKLDPQVQVTWSDETMELHIIVTDNPLKAVALRELLAGVRMFGDDTGVIVIVEQVQTRGGDKYLPTLVAAALEGNPLYNYMYQWNDPEATSNPLCWCVMDKRIVQYPNDNLHHLYGDETILPETLAAKVFGDYTDHIFYCTNNPERPIPGTEQE